MVYYFIYAKDVSYSTDGVVYYHQNGLKTLNEFKSDVLKIKSQLNDAEETRVIYLHWGRDCVEVDEETTIATYEANVGNGSFTEPETIIKWIKNKLNIDNDNKIKLLYIITDGLISDNSVNKCLELNENVDYETVVFHGIHENLNSINLSVAASFFKNRCTIFRNNELFDDVDISKEFDYSTININNFVTEKENLRSFIKLKYINSKKTDVTALSEIEKLKKLRNNLFLNLPSESENDNNINLNTTNKEFFLEEFKKTKWYKSFSSQSYDLRVDIEKSISTLINYIMSDKKSFAFDALKFETKFTNEVSEEPIVDINFATNQEIEFPDIILDDDKGIPVILCTELNLLHKIIFHQSPGETPVSPGSFSKFKSMMDCPLFLLNDPELNESVGYFYTLNVYKQLLEQPQKLEPRSRRPFHGGLVLVDTDDFDAYNDYIMSATYFNFKKVKYNIGLFYFVLWKIAENKQWMDRNVIDQFKKYMLRRVASTICNIGLSSLPLDPQINVSLPTALWYCVELSTIMFKDNPIRFTYERLRMYYSVAHSMIEILNYFQYNLDSETIDKRMDLIRHVMILKKIPLHRDKVLYMVEKIFVNVNGFLISEIENSANVKKLNYLKLKHKEILRDDIINEKVDLNDYVYLLHRCTNDSEVPICDKTFRPYFIIEQNKSYYSKLLQVLKKIVINNVNNQIVLSYDAIDKLDLSKILSVNNLFLLCVADSQKYPTIEEFKQYILKKKKFKDDFVTIFPVNVHEEMEKIFKCYENVIKDVNVSIFVEVSKKYVNRFNRIKGERESTFENDDKINKFILKEEQINNLEKSVNECLKVSNY